MIMFLTGCYPGEDFGVNVSMYVKNAEGGLCSANITSSYQINEGNPLISEVGICWEETLINVLPTIKRNTAKASDITSPYSILISNLKETTSYVVRPYMLVDGFIVYGDVYEFKTPSNSQYLPILGSLKLIKAELDKLSVSSLIVDVPFEYPVTEVGICYTDQSKSDFTAGMAGVKTINAMLSDGKFEVDVTGLHFSTTYRIRAYAKNQAGTVYGNIESFRTSGDEYIPKLGQITITKNAPTYLEVSCTVAEPLKTDSIKAWFEYAKGYNNSQSVEAKIEKGIMTAKIENLQPSTTYNIVAKSENKFGAGSSYNKQVTTNSGENSKPTLSEPTITNIKADGVHIESKIKLMDTDYKALSGGFEYSTSSYLYSSSTKKGTIENDTILKLDLTGLSENTTYYVRAYVDTDLGKVYSKQGYFTTAERKPTISELNVKSIFKKSVGLSAMIKPYDERSSITEAGVQYTTYSYFSSSAITEKGTVTGDSAFVNLSNMNKGTKYLMRAYAISNNKYYYGPEKSITTKSDADYTPTMSEVIVSDTTMTSMTLNSAYTLVNEDYKVKEAGFQYYQSSYSSYVSNGKLCAGNIKDGKFVLSISGLIANSIYQIRPYVKLEDESVYYGKTVSVTTKQGADYFEDPFVSDLTMTSFKLSSKHKFPSETYKIKEAGFQYYKSSYPSYVSNGNLCAGTIKDGTITLSVSNLAGNSTYQVRPYVKLDDETIYYGNTITVKTKQASDYTPSFTETIVSDTTMTSMTLSSTYTLVSDDYEVKEAGFQYYQSSYSSYVSNGRLCAGTIKDGIITISLSELNANSIYQVRPYVKMDNNETYYGNTISVTTKKASDYAPIASVVSVSDTLMTSVKLQATVNEVSSTYPITEAGFQYYASTDPYYVKNGSLKAVKIENNVIQMDLTSLTKGETYQVRAYVKCSSGTYYGKTSNFKTLSKSALPSITCNDITAVSTSSFSVEASVKENHKSYPITEAGFLYIKSTSSSDLTLDTNNAIRKPLTIQNGKVVLSVDGLDKNSTYLVRAYVMSGNEVTYNQKTIRVYTNMDNYKPSLGTLSIQKQSGEYVASCTAITSQVFPVTECGFVYSTENSYPTIEKNEGNVTAKISDSTFTATMPFVKPQTGSTRYYVRAYAKNANGITYSSYEYKTVSWND